MTTKQQQMNKLVRNLRTFAAEFAFSAQDLADFMIRCGKCMDSSGRYGEGNDGIHTVSAGESILQIYDGLAALSRGTSMTEQSRLAISDLVAELKSCFTYLQKIRNYTGRVINVADKKEAAEKEEIWLQMIQGCGTVCGITKTHTDIEKLWEGMDTSLILELDDALVAAQEGAALDETVKNALAQTAGKHSGGQAARRGKKKQGGHTPYVC